MNTKIRICRAVLFFAAALFSLSVFADQNTIAFDGVMYKKLTEDFSSAIKVVEYIPENETAQTWRHKLSIRHYPHMQDARSAGALLDNALKQDPANTVEASVARKDKNEALVAYRSQPADAQLSEFHIVRYFQQGGVDGLVHYQFTLRAPATEKQSNQDKDRWANALAQSQWSLPEAFSTK